jgi:regulator of telomere elongation helicase 1
MLNPSGIKSVVLGSRDQLCVHPKVQEKTTGTDKIKLCNILTKAKKCDYYNNFSKSEGSLFKDGGGGGNNSSICDIEDFVTEQKKKRVCPYFKSRDLSSEADIIFVPYNYLLDASIRATLSLNLQGSIVILDEAHNVMKTCEDSTSVTFETQDLALAIHEADVAVQYIESGGAENDNDDEDVGKTSNTDLQVPDILFVKEVMSKLEAAVSEKLTRNEWQHTVQSYSGDTVMSVLSEAGLTMERHAWLLSLIQQIVDLLSVLGSLGGGGGGGKETGGGGGKGLTKVAALVKTVYGNADDNQGAKENMKKYYKLFIDRCQKNRTNSVFNMWCFHPGFAMKSLQACGIRSLILTSGTLKPLASFSKELGLNFDIQFSGEHVVKKEQVI